MTKKKPHNSLYIKALRYFKKSSKKSFKKVFKKLSQKMKFLKIVFLNGFKNFSVSLRSTPKFFRLKNNFQKFLGERNF
jgi:hypothetical protein